MSDTPSAAIAAATARRPAFGLPGRIQARNSRPRAIALVGLGDGGATLARRLSQEGRENLHVHVLAKSDAGEKALAAIQAGGGDLQRSLVEADMIFIVASRGDDVGLAPVVSRIAHSRNHPVTALYVVPAEAAAGGNDDATLKTLRSAAEMLVIVSDDSYVPAMIEALAD